MVNFDGQTQNQMMVRPWSTMVDHGQPWSDGQTVTGEVCFFSFLQDMKALCGGGGRGRGYSRGKVIVGSECWSEPETLKYIFFLEFDTPKIYQQVLRFFYNFAIRGLVGSIHISENSLLTTDI